MAAEADAAAAPSMNGELLHRTISPDRWCVCKQDLVFLRAEVARAIAGGRIYPTELDAFDAAEDGIGPNLYTLNELYIKPVTHAAGDPSWALMRNPAGLCCKLFITHAWIEGIYELLDKVLNCWPRGASGAYICILSNPQNLNISDMIREPLRSPFALALVRAPNMMVIPNHSSTIYGRLWCVFEAYVAYKNGKTIFEAAPKLPVSAVLKSCRSPACVWLLGLVIGFIIEHFENAIVTQDWFFNYVIGPLSLVGIALTAVSFGMKPGGSRTSVISVAMLLFGMHGVLCPAVNIQKNTAPVVATWGLQLHAETCNIVLVLQECCLFLACFCSQLDHLRLLRHFTAQHQLRYHYTGSITDATCSAPSDAENIRREIGADSPLVDETVAVLIKSGLSTPSLRYLRNRGVDISFVGFPNYGALMFTAANWIVWLLGIWRPGLAHIRRVSDFQYWWAWQIFPTLAYCVALPLLRRDKRAFAIIVFIKLTFTMMLIDVALTSLFVSPALSDQLSVYATLLNLLVLLLSIIGPRSICAIPCCGPWIVRAFVFQRSRYASWVLGRVENGIASSKSFDRLTGAVQGLHCDGTMGKQRQPPAQPLEKAEEAMEVAPPRDLPLDVI